MSTHEIIAFYLFTEIEDPELEVRKHKEFLTPLDVRARVYIARNGINAQMSFGGEDGKNYLAWLKSDPRFAAINLKVEPYHEHVMSKLTVKFREQLAAMDYLPNMKNQGIHLSPKEWKEMLEGREKETILIDVRNGYESRIGHFEGAEQPNIESFREFPSYADELKERIDPKRTKVMMYCTGGIRCELYSALLKEKGFEQVYQLHGGVINYGKEMGNTHWKGKLFVFDDRLSVPISDEEGEVISSCRFCEEKSDVYLNCANMDCNELFLGCPSCTEKFKGCCSESCSKAPRLRPFVSSERPKPFRKWYNYGETKDSINHDANCCSCFLGEG